MNSPLAPLEERMLSLYFARRPFSAAQLGGGLWDGGMPPIGADSAADLIAGLHGVRRDLARSPTYRGDSDDTVTARLMYEIAGYEIDAIRARWDRFTVSPLPEAGLASALLTFLPYASIATDEDGDRFARACDRIADTLAASTRELAAGRADGQFAVARLVRRSIDQIDAYLTGSVGADRYLAAVASRRESLQGRVRELVVERIRPAFARYRTELAGPVLDTARDDDRPGLLFVPGGGQIYAEAICGHTTMDITAEEAHRIGLQQVRRWRAEAGAIAESLGWEPDFAATRDRMRNDPALFFSSGDEIEAAARSALRRAERAAPTWIGPLPRAGCQVLTMDPVESPHGVLGHYETAPLDRHRPARYWVNVAGPEGRPRYEAEALAFHESVPGHHMEIAHSQERPSPSRFRRLVEILAYTEGWGLYAEGLADAMGLYSGPIDRLGMVSFALWRACRLVVDTGLHADGWPRRRAVDYLWHNTMLTARNIDNEVDRYIAHPGSALGYLLGRLTIEQLRDRFVTDPSDPAQLRAFHSAVLDGGPLSMSLLTERLSGSPDLSNAAAVLPMVGGTLLAPAPRDFERDAPVPTIVTADLRKSSAPQPCCDPQEES